MRARLRACLWMTATAALAAAGCTSAERWRFQPFSTLDHDLLWATVVDVLRDQGYRIAEESPIEGTLETHWRDSLVPFSRGGYRHRVHVKVDREEGERGFLVGIRVERQVNEGLMSPLSPSERDWKNAGDDEAEARVLLQHLRSSLGETGEPSIEFYERRR